MDTPPGFNTKHISPLHVPIVISDVANSSSSASGSAKTVFLKSQQFYNLNHFQNRKIFYGIELFSIQIFRFDFFFRIFGI